MRNSANIVAIGLAAVMLSLSAYAQQPSPVDDSILAQEQEELSVMAETVFVPSIMFSETDIKNLSKVVVALRLKTDPKRSVMGGGVSEEDILSELLLRAGDQEAEFTPLPEFYFASMIYRSKKDWTVWLRVHRAASPEKVEKKNGVASDSGLAEIVKNVDSILGEGKEDDVAVSAVGAVNKRITLSSKQPENEEFNVRVESVSGGKVTLAYKPDELPAAVARYRDRDKDSPRIWKFRNRMVAGGDVVYDSTSKEFMAKLRSNQTFSPDIMHVVEGKSFNKPRSSSVARQRTADSAIDGLSGVEAGNAATPTSMEREISEKLINKMQKIQNFLPVAPEPEQQ